MPGGVIYWTPQGSPGSRELPPGSSGKRRASLGAVARRFLLPVQPVKLPPELVEILALGGKPVNLPELVVKPRRSLGLLYKQFRRGRRGHGHLPFLDAAGVAAVRWAWAVGPGLVPDVSRWPRRRQDPQNRSPRPPLGGTGELFLHKFSGWFLGKMEVLGDYRGRKDIISMSLDRARKMPRPGAAGDRHRIGAGRISTSTEARPEDGDKPRLSAPGSKTAPVQDSTHTRTGANQNRTRVRRYSLGTSRRLRIRDRRNALGVRAFFGFPYVETEKGRGAKNREGQKHRGYKRFRDRGKGCRPGRRDRTLGIGAACSGVEAEKIL